MKRLIVLFFLIIGINYLNLYAQNEKREKIQDSQEELDNKL